MIQQQNIQMIDVTSNSYHLALQPSVRTAACNGMTSPQPEAAEERVEARDGCVAVQAQEMGEAQGNRSIVDEQRGDEAPSGVLVACNLKTTLSTSLPQKHDQQSIPWNIDRRVFLGIYLVVGFLTGNFFYAWHSTQVLYLRSGAYRWLCESNGHDLTQQPKGGIDGVTAVHTVFLNSLDDDEIFDAVCEKQLQAVNSLMPTGVAAMFLFAFVGGLSVDHLGPKFSAMMGVLFQIAGWALFSFCHKQFPLYLVANVLMGFGNGFMFVALLDSSKLFSADRQGMIIGMLSASRSLSFILPSIFNYVLMSFPAYVTVQAVCLAYVGVLVLCFALVAVIFPWSCFEDPVESVEDVFQPFATSRDRSALDSIYESLNSIRGKLFNTTHSESATQCGFNDSSFFSSTTSVGSTYSLSSQFRPSRVLPAPPGSSVGSQLGLSFATQHSNVLAYQVQGNSAPSPTATMPTSLSIRDLSSARTSTFNIVQRSSARISPSSSSGSLGSCQPFHNISAGLYLPLLPIAATTILSGTFFANSSREQLGSAVTLFVILNPFSFLSSVLMGYLCDLYRPHSVMSIMYLLSLLQFGLLLLQSVTSIIIPYISAIVSLLVLSFFLTQFYCYIALTFPRRHFGALSGFVIMCSGLFSLIVTPMCDFSSFASNYFPMNSLCLVLTATNIIFLYILYKNQDSSLVTPLQRGVKNEAAPHSRGDHVSLQVPTVGIM